MNKGDNNGFGKGPHYYHFDGISSEDAVQALIDWFKEHEVEGPPKDVRAELFLGPKTTKPLTDEQLESERVLREALRSNEKKNLPNLVEPEEFLSSFPLSDLYDGQLPEGVTVDPSLDSLAEAFARARPFKRDSEEDGS